MTAEEFVRGAGADDLIDNIDKACQDAANDIRDEVNAAHVKQGKWRYTIKENNKQTDDPVNHPSHYCSGDIECIDAIASALGHDGLIAFCRGNAIKYLWRAGLKGDIEEDLRKAAWYCERAAKEASR
jgi:hypothetical protein